MPNTPETNQSSKENREELKILITGDKPKNLLPQDLPNNALVYSKQMSDALEDISERAIGQIIKDNPGKKIVLLSGLELGIEQAAARRANEMGIDVKAFVPYKEHGRNWTEDFQNQYRELIGKIRENGSVIQVSDKEYNPQRAQLRDYRMVDESQLVVSLHNPENNPAHQKTLDYAAKHSKIIINMWQDAKKKLDEVSKNFHQFGEQTFTGKSSNPPEKTNFYQSQKIEIRDRITREDVRASRDKIFIFGDNLKQTGFGGQAKEMRGEENVVGIPTKKAPDNKPESFFTDKEFAENKKAIDEAFSKIPENATIVIPQAGIGTGLARLSEKAPQTFAYLNEKFEQIGFSNLQGKENAIARNVVLPKNENKVIVQNPSEKTITNTRLLDLNNIRAAELRLLSPSPQEIKALETDRSQAIAAYADRLRQDYKENKNGLRDGLKLLGGSLDKGEQITIACACRGGEMCHADVVKTAVEKVNLHVKNQQIQETNKIAEPENQSRVQDTSKTDSQKQENKANPRTRRAITEIFAVSENDRLLEKINQTDGRSQSEQASYLGKSSQFVRDIYERGGKIVDGKLIVPQEKLGFSPPLAAATQEYAVKKLGEILKDELRLNHSALEVQRL